VIGNGTRVVPDRHLDRLFTLSTDRMTVRWLVKQCTAAAATDAARRLMTIQPRGGMSPGKSRKVVAYGPHTMNFKTATPKTPHLWHVHRGLVFGFLFALVGRIYAIHSEQGENIGLSHSATRGRHAMSAFTMTTN